jgi:hypothetical protein
LIGVPVFLIVLTIPAQGWLLEGGPGAGARRAVFATLVAATMLQGTWFQVRFHQVAPLRGVWFDDSFPGLLDEALATGASPIYLVDGIAPPYLHAYWYGLLRGVPQDRFVHVLAGQSPPSGATVVSGEVECNACTMIDARGFFKLYRVR